MNLQHLCGCYVCFFFKQKTAYEMRISDWSSDVCSSDLIAAGEFTLQDLCELDSATYGNTTSFVSTQASDQKTDNYLFGGGFIFERGPGRVKFDLAYQESTFINEVVIVDFGKRLEEVVVESNAGIGAQYEFTGTPLRSEERRVGKECGSTGRSRWLAY